MSFLADADTFVRKVDSGYIRISDVPKTWRDTAEAIILDSKNAKADDTDVDKGSESI